MATSSQAQKNWYVVVVKHLPYKKAAVVLEKLGFLFYLPLQRQLSYWSDRKKWIEVPIFNPYIFLFTDAAERKLIFQSCNFFHFLHFNGKPATAREEEIEKVRMLCNYSTNMKIEQPPIQKGDLVEVINGPLSGMKGYSLEEKGRHRFLIHILSLGQFASVSIDSNWLKVCQQ